MLFKGMKCLKELEISIVVLDCSDQTLLTSRGFARISILNKVQKLFLKN